VPHADSPTAAESTLPSTSPPSAKGSADSTPDVASSPELLAGIRAFDAGNFAEARRAFEVATHKNPGDAAVLYNLGMACEKLGDRPSAETAYKAALALKPDLETAAEELGALYVDEEKSADAIAVLRPALGKHSGSGALHENLGVALAAHGDAAEARSELETAVRISPDEPMYHLTLTHWITSWRSQGAEEHLRRAEELAKGDIGMIAAVGYEYRMAGLFDACIRSFDRAVEIKDGGEVRTERALCKLGSKDDKGARADLQAAVDKEPSYGPAHYYLAGRLAMDKSYAQAAAEYSKYLAIEPNGSLSKQATERLRAAEEAAGKEKKAGGGAKKK
jgi:Flp pilus assembly protein TadD